MRLNFALIIDSQHPEHSRLCRVVDEFLSPRSGGHPLKHSRYYCSYWKNIDKEEMKRFCFRVYEGLPALHSTIVNEDEAAFMREIKATLRQKGELVDDDPHRNAEVCRAADARRPNQPQC